MGFKSDAELRRAPDDPNLPSNVGMTPGQFEGTATLLVSHESGWEYGEEFPITIVPNSCYELPFDRCHWLYWSGIEVTVNIGKLRDKYGDPGGRNSSRYFVAAALQPASCGWAVFAPLRGENKHIKVDERDEEIRSSVIAGHGLRDLPWDPFLRGPGLFAARLNDPMRLHYEAGQNLDNGFLIGSEPGGLKDAIWHFGICPSHCLDALGLAVQSPAPAAATVRKAPGSEWMVRAPRTLFAQLAQSAALFACAGRARGDTVCFRQIRSKAEKDLASLFENRE